MLRKALCVLSAAAVLYGGGEKLPERTETVNWLGHLEREVILTEERTDEITITPGGRIPPIVPAMGLAFAGVTIYLLIDSRSAE